MKKKEITLKKIRVYKHGIIKAQLKDGVQTILSSKKRDFTDNCSCICHAPVSTPSVQVPPFEHLKATMTTSAPTERMFDGVKWHCSDCCEHPVDSDCECDCHAAVTKRVSPEEMAKIREEISSYADKDSVFIVPLSSSTVSRLQVVVGLRIKR
jgi:hypothetical protein